MILELRGQFYSCTQNTHALLHVESIEFVIARPTGNGMSKKPYIYIQCRGYNIEWVCADNDEVQRRFAYLKSKMFECDMIKSAPLECKPIEEIQNNLEDL